MRWGGTLYGDPEDPEDGRENNRARGQLDSYANEPRYTFRCPLCPWSFEGGAAALGPAAYDHAAAYHPELLRPPEQVRPAPAPMPAHPLAPHVSKFLGLLGLACTDPKAAAAEAGKMIAGGLDGQTGGAASKLLTTLRKNPKTGVYEE